jgi:carboxyl-terminal processing protease
LYQFWSNSMPVNDAARRARWSALAIFGAVNVLFLSLAFGAGYVVRAATSEGWPLLPTRTGGAEQYGLLAEVRSLLEAHYIGEMPDDQALEHGAVRGLVAAVSDPYTVFVEPQAHELASQDLAGEYGGIGVTVGTNESGEIVLSPYRASPAERAGVVDGDVLLAVDEAPLAPGTTIETATALIRGLIETEVRLTIRHPDGIETTLTVRRERFEIPSTVWRSLPGDTTVGVIAISRFSGRTADEVKQAIEELSGLGVTRYILDLRNNGGGILEAAVDTAAHFLDGGVVMFESQRLAPEKTYSAPLAGAAAHVPLVVLVNANTASAAEIVAGALLDRARAPLVGQPTYGKGSVQLVYDLSDGSSLHVTAYRWYTPARRDLEANGLPPTYLIEPGTGGADAELSFAVDLLNSMTQAPSAVAASALP